MKYLTLIFLMSLLTSCHSQNSKKPEPCPVNIYPFKDYTINLENLNRTKTGINPEMNFKIQSKYAGRFSFPHWFGGYPDSCLYHNRIFKSVNDSSLQIKTAIEGKQNILVINQSDPPVDNVAGSNFLLSTSQGVIHVKRVEGKGGYIIRKYNENGNELFKVNFEHTNIDISVYAQTYYPYLYYFAHTDQCMVFTSYDEHYHKTILLDFGKGKLTSFNFIVNGIIRTEDEKAVAGLIQMDEEKQTLTVNCFTSEWTVKTDNNYYDRAETLLMDSTLVISTYPNIATGSALAAYNFYTGKLLWKADVKQLNVGHSKYYNAVTLSAYNQIIIMEGTEAYGSYLQIFDSKTGKRLFTEGDFR
jgi:hypothetical protein